MAAQRRALFVLPAFILGCALAGGLLGSSGQQSGAVAPPPGSEESVNSALNSFAQVYDLVQQNEASKVSPDKSIYKGAIPGMLRTLDPHSNFFDPRDYQTLREDQRGHYYGVGMQVRGVANGKTMVVAPFTGSPAYRAGLRPGDLI